MDDIELFITTLDQAPPDKGAQDASTQVSLRLGHDSLVDSTARVKNDARRGGFGIGIGIGVTRHHLKHPIDHADMEVHMLIQAGAEAVDESHCADMQSCLICLGHLRRTGG